MASSGTMFGNTVNIGGQTNNYYFVNWQVASQSIANNTSTINWQNYFHYTLADAQLDNGDVVAGGATRYDVPGRVYNYAGNFTTRDLAISSGSFTVSHDAGGNYNLTVSGLIAVFNVGNSSGSQTWALPTIPRYANFTSVTSSAVTDVGYTVNFTLDATCDRYAISVDNGATYGAWVNTSFTTQSVNVATYLGYQLRSDTQYTYKVKVRRTDSQLETISSSYTATTASQNSFAGFF